MFHLRLCICIAFIFVENHSATSTSSNLTNFMALRQKRSLTFEGGSLKFSVAGVWPLYLEDRVKWRTVNCIAGISTKYKLPKKPMNPWDKWVLPYGKSLQSAREEFDKTGYFKADTSRIFAYAALEAYMNRNGRNGRQCLLRSICENAQVNEHDDVYSRILDIVLTPGKDNFNEGYRDAMEAGKFGADCLSTYSECPYGDSFLDRLAVLT